MPTVYYDLLTDLKKTLQNAGVSMPKLEAQTLLGYVTKKSSADLVRDYRIYASDETVRNVKSLLEERLTGKPLAYIVGSWNFYGMDFEITPDVLIPRDDSMILAEKAVSACQRYDNKIRLLDLCTGSGCIGISVAEHSQNCRSLILGDISDKALQVARINTGKLTPKLLVNCMKLDVLSDPPGQIGSFSVITCNPPYISSDDTNGLDDSVKKYEPLLALDGGSDGLDFYRVLAQKWMNMLTESGTMLVEIGIHQEHDVIRIFRDHGYTNIHVYKDLEDIPRVIEIIKQ